MVKYRFIFIELIGFLLKFKRSEASSEEDNRRDDTQ